MERLFWLSLVAAAALAQPVIRVTTRLVEVDVVVRDRNGAVADLTKDDFTVYDQGKPQTIAAFEKASSKTPAPAAPSKTFANHPAGPNAAPAVSTVVLLDLLNGATMDQHQARPDVLKFLRGVQPSDRVAIFSLSGGVLLEQNFTGDAKLLAAAVERGRWGAGMLWPPAQKEAHGAAMAANAAANAELARLAAAIRATFYSSNIGGRDSERVRMTCIALSALSRYLAKYPGRKNLVWVTAGVPLTEWADEPKLYIDEVSQADHALNDAHVSVYPIDVAGLPVNSRLPALGMAHDASERTPGGDLLTRRIEIMGGKGSTAARHISPNQGFFNYVARFTGGQAFTDANGIFEPMQKAAADAEATYVLGFYADSAALDSRRHTLKVEVKRRGVELRHRESYMATVEDPGARLPTRAEIEQALATPVDASGIAIAATVEAVDRPGFVRLSLRVPARDVDFEKGDKEWTAALALRYLQRSADGRDLGRISETLNLRYDDEHFQALSKEGVAYGKIVRPSPEAATLRILVVDRNSGRLGSLTLPLGR
jgi:VWFA-related protein